MYILLSKKKKTTESHNHTQVTLRKEARYQMLISFMQILSKCEAKLYDTKTGSLVSGVVPVEKVARENNLLE